MSTEAVERTDPAGGPKGRPAKPAESVGAVRIRGSTEPELMSA